MTSVQCDAFGKELLEEDVSYLFEYKRSVPVGILGQIDELIGVTEPGHKAHQMNTHLNVKTANKNLQFGSDKCKTSWLEAQRKNLISYKQNWKLTPGVQLMTKKDI